MLQMKVCSIHFRLLQPPESLWNRTKKKNFTYPFKRRRSHFFSGWIHFHSSRVLLLYPFLRNNYPALLQHIIWHTQGGSPNILVENLMFKMSQFSKIISIEYQKQNFINPLMKTSNPQLSLCELESPTHDVSKILGPDSGGQKQKCWRNLSVFMKIKSK